MFGSVFRFELAYQRSTGLFWLALGLFALFGFAVGSAEGVGLGGSVGQVDRNAPVVVLALLASFSLYLLFVSVAFAASPLLRDFELETAELFFTTQVSKRDYVYGRFAAGIVISLVILVAVAIALAIGPTMPWVDATRVQPFSPWPYLHGFAVFILPNLVLTGALFALLGLVTRSLLGVYVGLLVFLVLWGVASNYAGELGNEWFAALVDPFGVSALDLATRYWPAAERNAELPPLTGYLLWNRVIWIAVAIALVAAMPVLFKREKTGTGRGWFRRRARPVADLGERGGTIVVPSAPRRYGFGANLVRVWSQAKLEVGAILKARAFLVMLLLAVALFLLIAWIGGRMFGTPTYPVTAQMVGAMIGAFGVFLFIVVVLYSGELVWRERSARVAEVVDAMPTPDWVPLAAKLAALVFVVLAFYVIGIVAAIGFQLANGYTLIEPGQYLARTGLVAIGFVLYGVLAVFLQVATNQKFAGCLLMLLVFAGGIGLNMLHFDHHLYRFPSASPLPWSDMNGFGHWLPGHLTFRAYWGSMAVALVLLASVLWVRGVPGNFRARRARAAQRLRGPVGAALAVSLAAFVGLGAWIFWNTTVLNVYEPNDVEWDLQAQYEKKYRQYLDLPQPRITAVKAHAEIYPHERRAMTRATFTAVNRHDAPIADLHLLVPSERSLERITLPDAELVEHDADVGYRIYRLKTPLAPGAELEFEIETRMEPEGFTNGTGNYLVVENGTFYENAMVLPRFGYDESGQLTDPNERRKRDLPKVPRMATLENPTARDHHYLQRNADWITYEATVGTSEDQVALAPGDLVREWRENGRRYFHYRVQGKMLPFFAFLSARWAVKKDRWNDVAIEVYHHPEHHWNVDRMIDSAKDTLAYASEAFSPYQHRQYRIFEFPAYRGYAQAFPGMIPFSESIGFIADNRDADEIDYAYYVTAHEAAHQWWAHQVIGAQAQGSTLLSESLAQYTALMVMEREYGRDQMRKFLKHELDAYLTMRVVEQQREQPLVRVENQQYVHYNKGSLAFYQLREVIGEERLNRALAGFVERWAFQGPPYPTSQDLVAALREAAGPEHQQLVSDLFEHITLYDSRVTAARAKKRDDGKYEVVLDLHAGKLRAGEKGKEVEVPLDDLIEIGVFARKADTPGATEPVLALERRRVTKAEDTVTLVVDGEPFEAGFDPYNKLIDRNSTDNRKRVALE